MKSSTVFVASFLLLSLISEVSAQHATELSAGYYIVVGAYAPSRENVAQNYTEVLMRRGFNAAYGFNTEKKFFYVYIKYFDNLKESLSDMNKTRKDPEFGDAWVRVIPGQIPVAKKEQPQPAAPALAQATPAVKSEKVEELQKSETIAAKDDTPASIVKKETPSEGVAPDKKTTEVAASTASEETPKAKDDQMVV
jgi:hypothetical protein